MSNLITTETAAHDIAALLASLGYGTVGTDIFTHEEPDGDYVQDDTITVYDTSPLRPPETEYVYEYPSAQVRVRRHSPNARVAAARVMTIMNALHGYVGTVGSNKYTMIRVVNGPMPLGKDHRGRYRFTFNLDLQRSN